MKLPFATYSAVRPAMLMALLPNSTIIVVDVADSLCMNRSFVNQRQRPQPASGNSPRHRDLCHRRIRNLSIYSSLQHLSVRIQSSRFNNLFISFIAADIPFLNFLSIHHHSNITAMGYRSRHLRPEPSGKLEGTDNELPRYAVPEQGHQLH